MRSVGVLDAPSGGPGAHVCWEFDEPSEFREAAAAFLSEGLSLGERLVYVADAGEDDMRADVADMAGATGLVESGDVLLQPVRPLYQGARRFDPVTQVRAYRDLIASARDDGYSGLRVAADATILVAEADARRRFLEYEVAVDRLMSTEPMTAMCAYHGPTVGPAVAELLAVHPLVNARGTAGIGFRCFSDDGVVHVDGEIDLSNQHLFAVVLAAVERSPEPEPALDLGQVSFMGVRGLTELGLLASRMKAARRSLRVTGASEIIRRCCEVLGFDALVEQLVDS